MFLLINIITRNFQINKRLCRYGNIYVLQRQGCYWQLILQPRNIRKTKIAIAMLNYHGELSLLNMQQAYCYLQLKRLLS